MNKIKLLKIALPIFLLCFLSLFTYSAINKKYQIKLDDQFIENFKHELNIIDFLTSIKKESKSDNTELVENYIKNLHKISIQKVGLFNKNNPDTTISSQELLKMKDHLLHLINKLEERTISAKGLEEKDTTSSPSNTCFKKIKEFKALRENYMRVKQSLVRDNSEYKFNTKIIGTDSDLDILKYHNQLGLIMLTHKAEIKTICVGYKNEVEQQLGPKLIQDIIQ